MPFLEERTGLQPSPRLAEVLLALDRPGDALAVVERTLALNAADSAMLDRLLLWGARAAAHLVQCGEDARDRAAVLRHRAALERLVDERAGLPGTAFAPSGPRDTVTRATRALFEAETGLAQGTPGELDRWQAALAACAQAGMWWEHHGAAVRLARALVEAGVERQEAARLLRAGHAYAVAHGALPLATAAEEVAGLGRIDLTAPAHAPAAVPQPFAGLTARETEVLGQLVANRTYAEIAAELFISEKTVSVHVSNLLRKTQTSSRREVAALARRVGWSDGPVPSGQ
jgi:DNA-binding CsgD family transcriptional regulator